MLGGRLRSGRRPRGGHAGVHARRRDDDEHEVLLVFDRGWITGSAGASSLISICAWVVVVTPAAIGCVWPSSATPGSVSRTAPAGPA